MQESEICYHLVHLLFLVSELEIPRGLDVLQEERLSYLGELALCLVRFLPDKKFRWQSNTLCSESLISNGIITSRFTSLKDAMQAKIDKRQETSLGSTPLIKEHSVVVT